MEQPLLSEGRPIFTMESGPGANLSAEEKFQIEQYTKIVKFAEAAITGSHPRIRIESLCPAGSTVCSSVTLIMYMFAWCVECSFGAAGKQSTQIARGRVHLCPFTFTNPCSTYIQPPTLHDQSSRRKSELLSKIGPRVPSLAS
jgi:hypothetical protein